MLFAPFRPEAEIRHTAVADFSIVIRPHETRVDDPTIVGGKVMCINRID